MLEVPEPTPEELRGASDYRHWKPEYQQRALEMLRQAENQSWRPFFCENLACDGHAHEDWEWEHARADQRPPKWTDEWFTLLLSGGRGSGKTRAGSEITHRASKIAPRIILVGSTGPDLRSTMVEGESGILATARPGERPMWEPSKKTLTWPNGCIGEGFSAEEPDRLRGRNAGFAWCDEPAHWPLVKEVWSNMELGLRLGRYPKIIATSTPKPTAWVKGLIADPMTVVHRVSTYANLQNLAPTFRRTVLDRYEGTRLGRQELHGEILEDVEGALWSYGILMWIEDAPSLKRIVVGVDPAGTTNKKSDETGIVVVGIDDLNNLYVLADYTGRYSPAVWAKKANDAYEEFSADAIVVEKTYGQDMVAYTLENSGYRGARLIKVDSRRGKELRAEPIVALYEKARVYHVGARGALAELEDEMTTWVPGQGASPNRVDALVHAATDLAKSYMPAEIANPNTLLRGRPPALGRLRLVN